MGRGERLCDDNRLYFGVYGPAGAHQTCLFVEIEPADKVRNPVPDGKSAVAEGEVRAGTAWQAGMLRWQRWRGGTHAVDDEHN